MRSRLLFSALCSVVVSVMLCIPAAAQSYDWDVLGVNVTLVEATYMPLKVTFQINTNASTTCTSQTWLTWNPQGADEATQQANANAIYALLLTAKVSGTPVSVFGMNTNCTVSYLHLGTG
jgi:hypothetical protein